MIINILGIRIVGPLILMGDVMINEGHIKFFVSFFALWWEPHVFIHTDTARTDVLHDIVYKIRRCHIA